MLINILNSNNYKLYSKNKQRMKAALRILIIILTFLFNVYAYIEFQLIRVPPQPNVYNYDTVQCFNNVPTKQSNEQNKRMLVGKNKKNKQQQDTQQQKDDQDSQQDDEQDEEQKKKQQKQKVGDQDNFKEICYQKDISYAIELYNSKKELMLLSIDLTVPISWVKGQKCFLASTHNRCQRVEKNYLQKIESIPKKIKKMLKKKLWNQTKKKKKSSNSNQQALIQGSSQVVKGILQKTQSLQFKTKDSGRLTRFLDVILLGLFLIGINSNLNLQNTTFINALQISPALNYLCDGAISLRFDENSQNSFLKQMMNVAQSQEQLYVTIFIGEYNQSITIGDLSVKNSAMGLSGVNWVPVEQDKYGKLPNCQSIRLTQTNSQAHKQVKAKLPIVMTLSSSSITIPKQILEKVFQKLLSKNECSVNETTRYVQCQKLSSKDIENKELNFLLGETSVMIPLKQLVFSEKKHQTVLKIKGSLDEQYIILGQPFFKRYFVILDYKNDRVGLSLQRKKFTDALIDVVTLIRFVIWTFLGGCCIIIFLLPMQKCYSIIINRIVTAQKKNMGRKARRPKGTFEQQRKLNYTPVIQQQINPNMKQIINEEAEGI